jgi:hypothetical protein
VEDNKLASSGKKKTKELKVLDAKAAQNLSVVLGECVIIHPNKLIDC